MNFSLANKKMQWIALFFLAFIWGSSFILMKKGLSVFSAAELATLRVSLAYIGLFPLAIKHFKILKTKHFKWVVGTALTGNLIPAFLFAFAQTKLSSGLAGILNSLTPIFALIIAFIFFQSRIGWVKIIGAIIGLIGSVLMIYNSSANAISGGDYWYSLLVIIASICYAISVNIMKYKLQEVNSIAITSLAFFVIGPVCISYLIFNPHFIEIIPTKEGLVGLGYVTILSFIGTALALVIFNELIKHTSAIFATSVTYIIPIVAVVWGAIDGEVITMTQLLLFGVILGGVYITSKGK